MDDIEYSEHMLFYLSGIGKYIDESDIGLLDELYEKGDISKQEYNEVHGQMTIVIRDRKIKDILNEHVRPYYNDTLYPDDSIMGI